MRRLLRFFFVVVVLGPAPAAKASLEAYRVMPGSRFSMDIGGTFSDVHIDFVEGSLVKVNVIDNQVVSIRLDEIIVNQPAANVEILTGLFARVSLINNVDSVKQGEFKSLPIVMDNHWLKPSQMPSATGAARWVGAKPEGFFRDRDWPNYVSPPGRETHAWLSCVHTGYSSSPRSQMPVCSGAQRFMAGGGFIKAQGAFGGPFPLEGQADFAGVGVALDIFGADWTKYTQVSYASMAQALPWVTGTARARVGATAPGNPDGWAFGSKYAGSPSTGDPLSGASGLWNANTAVRAATLGVHAGQAPIFNPDGAAAYPSWAEPAGAPAAIRKVSGAPVARSFFKQVPGAGSVRRDGVGVYVPVGAGNGNGWAATTHTALETHTVSTRPLASDTVTITLVSPAIVNPTAAMNLVGELSFHLQKVPEPTAPILLVASAATIAGLGFAKRQWR